MLCRTQINGPWAIVRLRESAGRQRVRRLRVNVFTPGLALVFLGALGAGLVFVDTAPKPEQERHDGPREHPSTVRCVVCSPDGGSLACIGQRGELELWDTRAAQRMWVKPDICGAGSFCVAFSPDGKTLAYANLRGTVTFCDPSLGQERATFETGDGGICALAFSPDGKRLVTASLEGLIRVRRTATFQGIRAWRVAPRSITVLSLSRDGSLIATGHTDKAVRIYDTQTGAQRLVLPGHALPISGLAFSPDGRSLASAASGDPAVRLWDCRTGAVRVLPWTPEKTGWSIAFSPDGRFLAGGSNGDTILMWNLRAGGPPQELHGHSWLQRILIFCPPGTSLASAGADGTMRLTDVIEELPDVGGSLAAASAPDLHGGSAALFHAASHVPL